MVSVTIGETEAVIHRASWVVVAFDLKVCMPCAASVRLLKEVAAQSAGVALAACGGCGEHIVQTDQRAFERKLPAGHQLRIDVHFKSVKRHRRVLQALAVRLPL